MNCPECKQKLDGIPPLDKEEWICHNDECPLYGKELYGSTQDEVDKFARECDKRTIL